MFIDVHCHLDMCENPDAILAEAKKKNVIVTSAAVNADVNAKLLSWKHTNLRKCLGLYPIDGLKCTESEIDDIISNIRKNKEEVWGIGEVGIDYKESTVESEHEKQRQMFRKFVSLAIELDKPIIVHSRKAEEECIKILEELGSKKVIMHCFSGGMKLVDRIIANGWMLSIPSNVTFSQHFQAVVTRAPITQLLCETDSPYLHPEKAWPNSPVNVLASYNKIAEIKKIELSSVEKQIEKNINSL